MRLSKYLMRYKYLMAAALFLSIAGNVFALIGPKLSGQAIDAITGTVRWILKSHALLYSDGNILYCIFSNVLYTFCPYDTYNTEMCLPDEKRCL